MFDAIKKSNSDRALQPCTTRAVISRLQATQIQALFFSAGPDYLSSEPAETDEDNDDDANNQRDQVGTNSEETGGSRPPLRRRNQCHLCDQKIREECRRDDDLPYVVKRARIA